MADLHIGDKLKQYRENKNLRASEMASKLGVSRQLYASMEDNSDIKFGKLLLICTELEIPLSFFLENSNYENLIGPETESMEYSIKLSKLKKTLIKAIDDA